MRTAMIILVLAAGGCGGGSGSSGPSTADVAGTWILDINTSCAAGMTFNGNGYARQLLCILTDGSLGNDVESGDFTVAPGRLNFGPRRASCPSADHSPWAARYSVSGTSLTLSDDAGADVYAKAPPGGSSSVRIQFGCWTMGTFAPSPVADL